MMKAKSSKRQLIVNADDFGLSPGVNAGIIESHERGIVTATSLMVRWPAAEAAAAYARTQPTLDVGIHIDLSEWICRDGKWEPLYEVVSLDDASAVAREIDRQFAEFERLMGHAPSHIDSHQHAHRNEPVRSIVGAIAERLNVPLRHFTPGIEYSGGFYGQDDEGNTYPDLISVPTLLETLGRLQPGITELGCHPARGRDIVSMYLLEREDETVTLCDPRIRQEIESLGIHLCSFDTLAS
jgi:predicted glycoside hydrolase/deacetylase ChbG (UPF0249 family)